jgi:cell division protein FtsL
MSNQQFIDLITSIKADKAAIVDGKQNYIIAVQSAIDQTQNQIGNYRTVIDENTNSIAALNDEIADLDSIITILQEL